MNHFRSKSIFYKKLVSIALPIAIQNAIIFSISFMDTLMLGQYGSIQLSASNQANLPGFLFQIIIYGLTSGGCVLASQYWGKRDLDAARTITGIVLRCAILGSLVFSAIVLLFTEPLMTMTINMNEANGEAIRDEAVKYLKIVGFSYIFSGISSAYVCIVRSVEIVKISMITSLISCVTNIFFNWIFIYGNMGAPEMGIRGAALGTLIAKTVEFTIVAIYAFKIDKKLKFRLKNLMSKDKLMRKDFFKYSVPVVVNEAIWASGIVMQSVILGNISTQILGSNSIASSLQQLASVFIIGVGNATAVIIGKHLGENDIEGARSDAKLIIRWSVVLGFVSALIVFVTKNQFVSLYSKVDPEIQDLAVRQLSVTSVIIFFIAINMTGIVGVLRASGDTKFAVRLETIALWVIAIPCGALSGFVLDTSILVTYAFLKSDEIIKTFVTLFRVRNPKIFCNITRETSNNI